MNLFALFFRRHFLASILALAALAAPKASAVLFDGGIDSTNLGKGDWVYYIFDATNQMGGNVPTVTNLTSFMNYEKSQGMLYIIIKAGTGSTNFNGNGTSPQFTTNVCTAAHNAGLKIMGYTRSYGSDVPGEIAIADYCFNCGADAFVLDAEAEWESNRPWIGTNGPALAIQLASGIKANWPTKFLAHAPMPIISYHSSFPYKEFGYYCDTVMPQDYWYSFGMTPSATIDWMDTEWRNFQNGLTGIWTNAIKPLAPVGQAYADTVPDKDPIEFMDYLIADPNCVTAGGYKGANWWRADLHSSNHWVNIKASTIGYLPGVVNNIVFDNLSGAVTGSWTSSALATNRFGTNYIYKGQGTGSSFVKFTPTILTAGDYKVYEWHTVGANRSTAAQFLVVSTAGTNTVPINQQLGDAQWNLVGTFNFAAGTAGYIRIQDNHPDAGQVVIADGIKFVFAGSINPPAAPSGLTATAVGTQINLAWTDNSTNENNFIVARSTVSGGPYSDIATVAANSTTYSDPGLSPGTYYYVVRAVNSGGSSANSNQASATVAVPPPSAPSNLAATPIHSTRIDLTWSDNSNNESNFIVARSTTAGGPYNDIATVAANSTFYSNTGLSTNTTYYYVVRATNAGGASANSNEASATTPENDLLIDNKSALVVGAWSTGTSSTDKYGTDYRYILQGTGANYLRFAPYIATGAAYELYEWHPQGSNRTTNAPIVVAHNDGVNTVYLNQKVNGGKWNYIGVYNFTNGNTGNIKITDGFPDGTTVVMADAIKLIQSPIPPSPTGLTATAASAWQINLAWTDTSTNETEFVVRRGTAPGGLYSAIANLPANTTSFSDTNLAPNTTYYYVVRARNGTGASANSNESSATTFKAVHVNSIAMSWVLVSGNNYRARATVNMKDSAGNNVNAATVTGNFTGAIVESNKSGVTGTGGTATITTTASIVHGTVTFTMQNISGTAMSYDSSANVVSSANETR
jgi:hypothetical protein